MAEIKGRFKKGVSGNPAGRPKGTGWKTKVTDNKAHEVEVFARLEFALTEIDRWHQERLELLNDFILGLGAFPYKDFSAADRDS